MECFDDLRCFSLSCTALHSTAASKAELLTPSSVICVPVLGSLHLYVRFRQFILSSGILHFSRICFMKSSSPSCPVLTLHRKLMLLNLTMMSPLTLSGAGLGCCSAVALDDARLGSSSVSSSITSRNKVSRQLGRSWVQNLQCTSSSFPLHWSCQRAMQRA